MNEDTIAALATPEGKSAIAVIRMSGEKSTQIIKKVFKPVRKKNNFRLSSWKAYYGFIRDIKNPRIEEEVIITIFKEPNSYTREDMVEISCHGGKLTTEKILKILFEMGARPAKRGEFTKRALLNGRIDLVKAEAINKLIETDNIYEYEKALSTIRGKNEESVKILKEKVQEILEKIEVSIEEPEDYFFDREAIIKNVNNLLKTLEVIIKSSEEKSGTKNIKVALIGQKNAGKSTLFNKMVKENKSIVTEVPGTTRDIVEKCIKRKGVTLELLDTAGYGGDLDKIDSMAVRRTLKAIKNSDIILFIVDGEIGWSEEDDQWVKNISKDTKIIFVWNKNDVGGYKKPKITTGMHREMTVEISALKSQNVKKIWELIEDQAKQGKAGKVSRETDIFLSSKRQLIIIKYVKKQLENIRKLVKKGEFAEIIAYEMHEVRKKIDEWLGTGTRQEILDDIFDKFCMGK